LRHFTAKDSADAVSGRAQFERSAWDRDLKSGGRGEPIMTIPSRLSVVLFGVLLISGCAARVVRIAELKDQPAKYDNKSVTVNGVVTRSWGIPLVPFQFYNVDDGSGEITVTSNTGRTPAEGAHVRVKGRLNEVAVLGGRSIGLHLQEEQRKDN
jgi:hypothetical protein